MVQTSMEKKNVKILIVDDHAIVREGLKTMLEMGDFLPLQFHYSRGE